MKISAILFYANYMACTRNFLYIVTMLFAFPHQFLVYLPTQWLQKQLCIYLLYMLGFCVKFSSKKSLKPKQKIEQQQRKLPKHCIVSFIAHKSPISKYSVHLQDEKIVTCEHKSKQVMEIELRSINTKVCLYFTRLYKTEEVLEKYCKNWLTLDDRRKICWYSQG